jgi:cysteine-rich repeat protein
MNKRSLTPLFSMGFLALTLAACGDDGQQTTAAEAGQSDSDSSTGGSNTNATSTTNSTNNSGTGTGTSDPTEGGMSDSNTGGTTGGSTGNIVSESESESGSMAVCGNEVVEGSEACDDGNNVDGDGCEADCTLTPSVCGNDIVEAGEACDDGNTEDGDECSADCLTATPTQVCGNGTTEAPEACDDGNQIEGDGCENDCTLTPADCGNGEVDVGEQCDDGNDVDGGPMDFCKNDCTTFNPPSCQAPANYEVCDNTPDVITDKANKKNALKAIGICDLQANNSVVTTAFEFDPMAKNNTWQVAKGFGSHMVDHDMDPNTPMQLLYSPREGDTFLMLSSGIIKAPNNQGIVTENVNSQVNNGDNTNSDSDALPAPFKVANGSNNGAGGTPFMSCDNGAGDNDCSDTLQQQWQDGFEDPNDRVYFTFKTIVPAGTFGYSFDFVFCSSEWPDWVDTGFNDLLIAYQVDPSPDDPNQNPPVDPYSGNVTFIPNPNNMMEGLPITITALDPYFSGPGYTFNEPQLQGTGFEQHACSDWFTAKGGVQPGAEITVGFYLADMSDSILATVALLDNFRWDCEGCIPSEVEDCGVQPM